MTSTLPPSLRASRPANTPTENMVIADGSSISPDRVMLAPNHTAVRRIIFMSISGVAARNSAATQPTASTTAPANRPITRPEPHPHSGALLSATSSATSQADSSTADSQLIRPGERTGDSGTNSTADTAAMTVRIIGSQNSQRYPRPSTIGPARTIPRPAPTAVRDARAPTAPVTLPAGNSSRMMPNATGTIPPAIP